MGAGMGGNLGDTFGNISRGLNSVNAETGYTPDQFQKKTLRELLGGVNEGKTLDIDKLIDFTSEQQKPKTFANLKGMDVLGGLAEVIHKAAKADRENPGGNTLGNIGQGFSSFNEEQTKKAREVSSEQKKLLADLLGVVGAERKFGFDKEKFGFQKDKFGKTLGLEERKLNELVKDRDQRRELAMLKATGKGGVGGKQSKVTPLDLERIEGALKNRLGKEGENLDQQLKNDLVARASEYYKESGDSGTAINQAIQDTIGNLSNLREEEFVTKPGFFWDDTESRVTARRPEEIADTKRTIEEARKMGVSDRDIKERLRLKGISKTLMKELGL